MSNSDHSSPSSDVEAKVALDYAASPAVVKLFGVLLAGWVLTTIGGWLMTIRFLPYALHPFASWVLIIIGTFVLFVGGVAILYKIIRDALRAS